MINPRLLLLSIIGFFFSIILHAQDFEYLGVIKLNDTSFISYKLVFQKSGEQITGYSLTDFAGKHETKSNMTGSYDEDAKLLTFREYDIVYTKSPVVQKDFCFVNFEGKVRNLDRAKAFSGDFKGLYADGEKCIDGMILVQDAGQVAKRIEMVDRKIQKSKRVSEALKAKISTRKMLDTMNMNIISKGENLNIFSADEHVKLVIYDAGKEDGDRINLIVDGKTLLTDYLVTKEPKIIDVSLKNKETKIELEAINAGTSPPNTVRLEIEDSANFTRTLTNLAAGENAAVTIIKK